MKVLDSHGNFVEIPPKSTPVINGTFHIKPEDDGKNPRYKSIHSSSVSFNPTLGVKKDL
jgi:hypothetical protein